MPADVTAAIPNDQSSLCLTLVASASAGGKFGDVTHTSRWSSTSLSPTRAIRHPVSGRPRGRKRRIASFTFLLRIIAEGAGS